MVVLGGFSPLSTSTTCIQRCVACVGVVGGWVVGGMGKFYFSTFSLFILCPSSSFPYPLPLFPPSFPPSFPSFFLLHSSPSLLSILLLHPSSIFFLFPTFLPLSLLSLTSLFSPTQCMVGVVPLGTGNDLARVLGWGAQCNDEEKIPALLTDMEKSSFKLLDRWSIQYTTEDNIDLSSLRSTTVSYGVWTGY